MASFPLRLSTGAMGTMALCTALMAIPDAAKAVPSVVPTGVTRYSPERLTTVSSCFPEATIIPISST